MFHKKNKTRKFIWSSLSFLLIIFSVFVFSNFVFSKFALAEDVFGLNYVEGGAPGMAEGEGINLGAKDPRTIAAQIINIALGLLGVVAVSIVIYGGFVWMTAEGNEEKITKAKGILKAGIIGLVIILASWGIASLVLNKLGGATGISEISCDFGETRICGFKGTGISTCDENGVWGECLGEEYLPGGPGSTCSYLGLVCDPATASCDPGLFCNEDCICQPNGQGDPCNEGDSCSEVEGDSCQSDLYCDQTSCTCQPLQASELGEACNDGESCVEAETVCNSSHGLVCSPDSCTCVGSPVITGISPFGGFCDNSPNEPCLNNGQCGEGGVCNLLVPNGALGNLITIFGYNFDDYDSNISEVNLILREDETNEELEEGEALEEIIITAQIPSNLNPDCGNTWSNEQIIVVIPTSSPFVSGDKIEIEVVTKTEKFDRSQDEVGPVLDLLRINEIVRPGICRVQNNDGEPEGKINEDLSYSGLNLTDSQAYFGNSVNNVVGFSNSFNDEFAGQAKVPVLSAGEVSTFAKKTVILSNFVDFKKLPEPPQSPSISFFEPEYGSPGQYITVYGSGFGNYKSDSSISFLEAGEIAVGEIEADYNFPPVCLQSVWSDGQVLIKVPENIEDGEYNIVAQIGNWEEVISTQIFLASSSMTLKPSLCKINPTSGPYNTAVTLWGEYFGDEAKAVFNNNKNSEIVSTSLENEADSILVNVPEASISGPVRVSRENLEGNSLNFFVGACTSGDDCPSGNKCCGDNTSLAGACISNSDDCDSGAPLNSVFEWDFTTGLSTTTPQYNGDEAYSCSSYNYCPEAYVCPNSPGFCSSYEGGNNPLEAGVCDNSCSGVDFCNNETNPNICTYVGENLDRCVLNLGQPTCSLSKNVEYVLGAGTSTTATITKNAVCKSYENGRSYYEISVNSACPTINGITWTMISPGKCVDTNNFGGESTCSLCPTNEFTCQKINNEDNYGSCVSERLCQGDFTCIDNICQKDDPAACQCCCNKNDNDGDGGINPACCAPLTCDNSCGISANASSNNDVYGLCSGCNVSNDFLVNDAACNCLGTSGKYCEASTIYPEGACLDCSALKIEDNCKAHNSSCCWDSHNNTCRAGISDLSVWSSINNVGLCPYYICQGDNPSLCETEFPKTSYNPSYEMYSSVPSCVSGCLKNCSQFISENECLSSDSCCWDNDSEVCKGGTSFLGGVNNGKCQYYQCDDSGVSENYCITTLNSFNGEYNNFSNATSCTAFCEPRATLPNEYCSQITSTSTSSVCSSNLCNQLDCLNENGELGGASNDCGTCCCNPNAENDKCLEINNTLACLPNKGSCTGNNRGLCCGCSSDAGCVGDSVLPELIGCGLDTCCKARPKIEKDLSKNAELSVVPEHKSTNVCRNGVIEINFDQRMDAMSLPGNILLLEETSEACSPGTYFIGQADLNKSNIWGPFKFIKNIFIKSFNSLVKAFGGTALAAPSIDKNYCSVLGTVDFEHLSNNKTKVYFKPNNLLKAGAKYFVVVKGDVDLNSQSGVKSFAGIGMNGTGYYLYQNPLAESSLNLGFGSWSENNNIKFNNIYYKNSYIWSFRTQTVESPGEGLCTIDYVTLSPSSYLFQTNINDINENDEDPNNLSFDSVKDRDKVYSAKAYSADSQIIQPTAQYSWTWDWHIFNQNVLNFYDDEDNDGESDIMGFSLNGNKRMIGVKEGVIDGQSNISVSTVLSSPYTLVGNNVSKVVPAYVMMCNNPWPAFDGETWEPWKDKEFTTPTNTASETQPIYVGQYNYEFYYCRDSGGEGTADDLPAFLSDLNVTKGNSLIKVCSNSPSQTCANSSECPIGGLCLSSFLKETYFFKESIPHFIENVSAIDNGTGGSLKILWESEKFLVDRYKIYYSFSDNSNQQQKIVNPEIECYSSSDPAKYSCKIDLNNLVNNQQYAIRVTAVSENMAETNFSGTVFKTPTESGLEQNNLNIPLNLQAEVLSTTSRTVKLNWEAPLGYSVADYKVYRGLSSLNYGNSFLTNSIDTEIILDLASAPNDIYYLAISSIGASSVESNKSNEVVIDLVNASTTSLVYSP